MIFWKYRVRDCKRRMIGHYKTLDEVFEIFGDHPAMDEFIKGLLRSGHSVSYGERYHIDIRGKYHTEGFSY
jgi:hypothetical protein